MTRTEALPALIVFLLISLGVGLFASQFTAPYVADWYTDLAKPEWAPPDVVFTPVWTLLYIMMAVAAWLAWHKGHLAPTAPPLLLFFLQLALNAMWWVIFFAHQQPGLAFVEIILLWIVILATIVSFWRIERLAGLLMVPYLFWVAYAAALNYTIWRMNL